MLIHIVKSQILSVALVASIGLMKPSFANAADVAHGEQVFSSMTQPATLVMAIWQAAHLEGG